MLNKDNKTMHSMIGSLKIVITIHMKNLDFN